MEKSSKLGEKYVALWRLSQKGVAMTNLEQKFTIEKRERNTHRKCNQNQKTVKHSKLGAKNCGRRFEMSKGERTCARAKYRRFPSMLTFNVRRILDIPFEIIGWMILLLL